MASALTERAAWEILQALHANVAEDQRPQSWSDLEGEQQKRIEAAANAAVAEVGRTYAQMNADLATATPPQPVEPPAGADPEFEPAVEIDYTNWRGERAKRRILPISLKFNCNEWHPEPQWFIVATDVEKKQLRWFALSSIHSWNGGVTPSPTEPTEGEVEAASIVMQRIWIMSDECAKLMAAVALRTAARARAMQGG